MIDEIALQGRGMTSQRTRDRLISRLRDSGIKDPRVLDVMRTVPRHFFVEEALASRAYDDTALPIGHGQTISQPYVVARMSELLIESGLPERVLEIGTGSGYQAAVLSRLVEHVYTVEIVEPLARSAARTLTDLGYENVTVRAGDGYAGWPEHAPFDIIVVTAAPDHLPQPLIDQLAPGGRMVVPVGPPGAVQSLELIEKGAGNEVSRRSITPVRFVPLTRDPN